MIRRRFLGLVTLTSISSAVAFSAKGAAQTKTATYTVRGFTCVTCATGLETLLKREQGVFDVKASYPEGLTTITYDPKRISQADLRQVIEGMGFKVEVLPSPPTEDREVSGAH